MRTISIILLLILAACGNFERYGGLGYYALWWHEISAGGAGPSAQPYYHVYGSAAVTCGGACITAGVRPGQIVTYVGGSDVGTVTLRDDSLAAGSLMAIQGDGAITLGDNDVARFLWSGTRWIEIGYSNNSADD